MPQNLELKARCADPDWVRAQVLSLPPQRLRIERQTDTYLHTPAGRLKLREIDGQQAQLIFYRRPDDPAARTSSYQIVPVTEPAALKAVLIEAWGLRGVVRKRREIFLWQNVRIHLDQVEGLGNFIEFEAVLASDDDHARAPAQLEQLCRLLNLKDEDRLQGSYGDAVLR